MKYFQKIYMGCAILAGVTASIIKSFYPEIDIVEGFNVVFIGYVLYHLLEWKYEGDTNA
jgi:hypothetical protein